MVFNPPTDKDMKRIKIFYGIFGLYCIYYNRSNNEARDTILSPLNRTTMNFAVLT